MKINETSPSRLPYLFLFTKPQKEIKNNSTKQKTIENPMTMLRIDTPPLILFGTIGRLRTMIPSHSKANIISKVCVSQIEGGRFILPFICLS
jgi:hypothetical protein